jgi:heat shock protein HtpX
MNLRSLCLFVLLIALAAAIGALVADMTGMVMALAIAVLWNGWAYFTADERTLRAVDAREVMAEEEPDLVALVRQLATVAGLPMPKVYVTDLPQANALSIGRTPAHGGVIVTRDLLHSAGLTGDEVAGVIAHELAHIRNRDAATTAIAGTVAGVVIAVAAFLTLIGAAARRNGGVAMVLLGAVAVVAAWVLRLAIGRSREYAADATGAVICGHPEWLASALGKLARHQLVEGRAEHLTLAPAFFVASLPDEWWARALDSHPPIEKRIARLEAILR